VYCATLELRIRYKTGANTGNERQTLGWENYFQELKINHFREEV
jgi:hypothetical protein